MATCRKSEAVLLACAVWLGAPPAGAQADDRPRPAELDPMQEAFRLYEAGKYLEAAAIWEQALAVAGEEVGWKLHYNLGLAYEGAKDVTRAVEHYEAFIRRVAAETAALPPELEQRREDAAARARAIQAVHVAVVLPRSTEGVTVRVDGGDPRPTGATVYLAPGKHVVEVVGPKGVVRQRAIETSAGDRITVDTADPTPPPAPLPAVPKIIVQEVEEPPSYPIALVLVGVGVTGLGFILPGVLFDEASARGAAAEDLGAGHTGYADALDEYESARTAYQISYVLPAALGVATLGVAIWGAVDVATWEPSSDTAARVDVEVAPGGSIVWLRGSF
jgi:tetratricopeptide (TPR) repeat protein